MKKFKKQHFVINMDIYPAKVIVSIDESDAELMKFLKKFGNTKVGCQDVLNMKSYELGLSHPIPSNHVLIRYISQKDYEITPDIIVHEVFHAAAYILDAVGISLELGTSEEAYAYLIQYLVREIYKKY